MTQQAHHSEQIINCINNSVFTYMSVNYHIQADAIGLDKRPKLYPILTVIFGKPVQLHRNHKVKVGDV